MPEKDHYTKIRLQPCCSGGAKQQNGAECVHVALVGSF